jgi:hypothetical protein
MAVGGTSYAVPGQQKINGFFQRTLCNAALAPWTRGRPQSTSKRTRPGLKGALDIGVPWRPRRAVQSATPRHALLRLDSLPRRRRLITLSQASNPSFDSTLDSDHLSASVTKLPTSASPAGQ